MNERHDDNSEQELHESHPNRELIDGLRALADFLEARPQGRIYPQLGINVYLETPEEFREAIRGVGPLKKLASGNLFYVRKEFGGGVEMDWNISREHVCERIVTTKIEPAKPERVLPAEPEKEIEFVEWRCPESILRPEADPVGVAQF